MHFVLAFDMDCGPAHTAANQEPCPPNHPCQKKMQSTLRGKILGRVRGPRGQFVLFSTGTAALRTAGNMLEPPPSLTKPMQSVRGAHEHDPICCPDVYFVLFFARDGGGSPRCLGLAPGRLGEGVFINREQ